MASSAEGDGDETRLDILTFLPVEVAHLILGYLGVGDLVRCSLVSKSWHHLANYNQLWCRLCHRWKWSDTSMVDNYWTHQFQMASTQFEGELEPVSRWKRNFERNYKLPRKWARGECLSYDLRLGGETSHVTCFHSDGDTLAVGRFDSSVTLFDVARLPQHLATTAGILHDRAVTALRTDTKHVVILQAGLIQMLKRTSGNSFQFVSCKSLEVVSSMSEVWERLGSSVEGFDERYSPLVSASLSAQQLVLDLDGEVYCAVRGRHLLYCWCPHTGRKIFCLQLPGHPHSSLKDATLNKTEKGNRMIHVLFSRRGGAVRVGCYAVSKQSWLFELDCDSCRVEGLLCGTSLLVGASRNGSILCWEQTSGRRLAVTTTLGSGRYLRPGTHLVLMEDDLIAYAEGSSVRVFDPRKDCLLTNFSVGSPVCYLRAAPFGCILVFCLDSCCLWHWSSAVKLYTLYLKLQWCSDYTDILYLDQTMILSKSTDDKGVRMTTFC